MLKTLLAASFHFKHEHSRPRVSRKKVFKPEILVLNSPPGIQVLIQLIHVKEKTKASITIQPLRSS